jgi:hypothetical protein
MQFRSRKARVVEHPTWRYFRKRLTITIDAPPATVVERLRASTHPGRGFLHALRHLMGWAQLGSYAYRGQVAEDRFDLRQPFREWSRVPPEHTGFAPLVLRGTMAPSSDSPSTTIVSVVIGMPLRIEALWMLLAVGPLAAPFGGVLSPGGWAGLSALLWGLAAVAYIGGRRSVPACVDHFLHTLTSPPRQQKVPGVALPRPRRAR